MKISGFKIKPLDFLSYLGTQDVLVVDFGGNSLKLAYAKVRHNKVESLKLYAKDITGLSDDDIAKTIRTIFNEHKLNPKVVLNIMPSHLAITKNIEIPSRDHQEIREIVNLQAGRHTPYSREEIIVDYIEIGTYRHNYTKVLLVIVARNVIRRQFAIFDRAGLRLERVIFAPEGISRFISNVVKIDTDNSPVSVAHIDEDSTDFTVVFKGKAVYTRSIPIGAEHFIKDGQLCQARFVDEIRNSLEAYEAEDIGRNPDSIILIGAIDQTQGLEAALDSTLHVSTKKIAYFKYLPINPDALKTIPLVNRISFLSTTCIFFALDDVRLALVPEEVRLKRAFEERSRDIIKTGILVLANFVLICSLLASKIYFKNIYLNKLDSVYQSQYKEVRMIESDLDKVRVIRRYLSRRGFPLEVLVELYNLLPQNMLLSDIKFDAQGKFSIRGIAQSMAVVFSFVENLSRSNYFKDVKNRYTTKRKEAGGDVADFEITCLLNREIIGE
jgi:Tfp pilus assembly PilM family ATPase